MLEGLNTCPQLWHVLRHGPSASQRKPTAGLQHCVQSTTNTHPPQAANYLNIKSPASRWLLLQRAPAALIGPSLFLPQAANYLNIKSLAYCTLLQPLLAYSTLLQPPP